MAWYIGITGRGRHVSDPLLHAWTGQKASRTGRNHKALCGRSIGAVRLRAPETFDPKHPRACGDCAKACETRPGIVP